MKTEKECIPCFYNQIIRVSNVLGLDIEYTKQLCRDFSKEYFKIDMNKTPAFNGRIIYKYISEKTKIEDPYKNIKIQNIDTAKKYYDDLILLLEKSDNKLKTALLISATGNLIDFGIKNEFSFNSILKNIHNMHFAIDDFDIFNEKLKKAKNLVIIGDNAGEMVFDLILLELLYKTMNIHYIVRSQPIINDAIYDDAVYCGIDEFAEIVNSGCDAPGMIYSEINTKTKNLIENADIIISKGQGNFEALSSVNIELFFLLTIKCNIVAKFLNLKEKDKVFKLHN